MQPAALLRSERDRLNACAQTAATGALAALGPRPLALLRVGRALTAPAALPLRLELRPLGRGSRWTRLACADALDRVAGRYR